MKFFKPTLFWLLPCSLCTIGLFIKIENLTSKLDMAHGKAKEIEAVCISCIAFDNRYCHALTLNK